MARSESDDEKRTEAHRDAQRGRQRQQQPGPQKSPEEEEAEKSRQAAAELIGKFAEQMLEKSPHGFLETGYFQPDPDELEQMPSGPVKDGTYSDKQLVVRFEGGKPVEIWRADAPGRPEAEALNV